MKKIALLLILNVLSSWILTEILLYSNNSFIQHTEWRVGKREVLLGLGSDASVITRPILAGNQLHLDSIFGFQELTLNKIFAFRKIEFNFKLKNDAYINFYIRRNDKNSGGLRMSKNNLHPSMYFDLSPEGLLTNKKIFQAQYTENWNHAMLEYQGNNLILYINSQEVFRKEADISSMTGELVLKGGMSSAVIDDIYITDQILGNHTVDFKNHNQFFISFSFHFLLVGLASGILILFSKLIWHKRFAFDKATLAATILPLNIFLISLLYLFFDQKYWSNLQFDNAVRIRAPHEKKELNISQFEQMRSELFQKWYQIVGGQVVNKDIFTKLNYNISKRVIIAPVMCREMDECIEIENSNIKNLRPKLKNEFRIVFIGTSQTIGAGATAVSDSFVSRTHKYLQQNMKSPIRLKTFNLAVSSSTAQLLFDNYFENYLEIRPDLIVLNLSNNDAGNAHFESELSSFISNKKNKAKFVLIKEANSHERVLDGLLMRHDSMEQVGKKFQYPVFDFHSYINSNEILDMGFFWWDSVHFTSAGHRLFAAWLGPELALIINLQVRNSKLWTGQMSPSL